MLCPEDRRPLLGGAVHFLSPLPRPWSPLGPASRAGFTPMATFCDRYRTLAPSMEHRGSGPLVVPPWGTAMDALGLAGALLPLVGALLGCFYR